MTYMQNLFAQRVEDVRTHKANEALKSREIDETVRSHKVNEALSERDLEEKIRHQITQDNELVLNNALTRDEVRRHNQATEQLMKAENDIKKYTAELNYAASNRKVDNDKYIAELNDATKNYIAANQLRIDMMNAKSSQKQAQASLNAAAARMLNASAAMKNAQNNVDKADSEKFRNYTNGAHEISSIVTDLSKEIRNWMPTPTNAASNAAGIASSASKYGEPSSSGSGDTVKEILESSGHKGGNK